MSIFKHAANLPKNAVGLSRGRRYATGGMRRDHRFHLFMDKKLHALLKRGARLHGITMSNMANKVILELRLAINLYDVAMFPDLAFNDAVECSQEVWLEVQPRVFRILEYLRWRFQARSMATILRRILRFYLTRSREQIASYLKRLGAWFRRRGGRVAREYPRVRPDMWSDLDITHTIKTDTFKEITQITYSEPNYTVPPVR